uniref:G_PROTEIN_RECEP_F1_2 domain-containing protein n=1 Tax=Strongyloides papillosus TaxID=174720 RepID=A0A0N5CI30_STREA
MDIINDILHIIIVILTLSVCSIGIFITWKNYGTDYDREYKKLILIQLSFGVLSGVVGLVSRCEIIIFNDYFILHYGYFSYYDFDIIIYKIIMGCYIFITGIDISFPSAVIISRYLIVCKSVKLTFKKVVLLTFLPISISIVNFYSGYIINYKITPVKFIISSIIIGIFYATNCIIISIFYQKYMKFMELRSSIMSERTKRKHKEFSRIILFQALIPSTIGCIPIFLYFLFFCFNYHFSEPIYVTPTVHCFSLVPCLNGLFFIFLSSKNRRTFLKIFKFIIAYFKYIVLVRKTSTSKN